ncbi:MAG: hypothetical protein ACYCWE_16980 [Eubacteriales bacterium]
MIKRILSATLAMLMMTGLLISCSAGNGGKTETSAAETTIAETTVPAIPDNLPDGLDLNGRTVKILSRLYERYMDELTVDELNADVVNDAVYNRLINVQDRLNVVVENSKIMGSNAAHGPLEIITKTINAGDDLYDVYAGSMYNSTAIAADGFWTDLNNVEYLDPLQPYWSNYYVEKATMGKALYTITGNLAISMIRLLGVTFFNKAVIDDYNIEDLYTVVRNGDWTISKELSLIKDIYSDLNGNGERDNDDLYGLGTSDTFSVDAYTSSFDLEILTMDEEHYPYINVNLDKADSIVNTVFDMCFNTTGVNTYHFDTDDSEMTEIANVFSQNRFVFMSNWLFSTETAYMRNMEADYGIIPYPKFDEDQTEYYTYANDQLSVYTIPRTIQDPSAAGAVLEALCAISKDTVVQAYYEIALKSKYSRDSETSEMLDLILAGFKLDPAWMYCSVMNGLPQNMLRTQIWNKKNNLISSYASAEKSYVKALDKLIEKFKSL